VRHSGNVVWAGSSRGSQRIITRVSGETCSINTGCFPSANAGISGGAETATCVRAELRACVAVAGSGVGTVIVRSVCIGVASSTRTVHIAINTGVKLVCNIGVMWASGTGIGTIASSGIGPVCCIIVRAEAGSCIGTVPCIGVGTKASSGIGTVPCIGVGAVASSSVGTVASVACRAINTRIKLVRNVGVMWASIRTAKPSSSVGAVIICSGAEGIGTKGGICIGTISSSVSVGSGIAGGTIAVQIAIYARIYLVCNIGIMWTGVRGASSIHAGVISVCSATVHIRVDSWIDTIG